MTSYERYKEDGFLIIRNAFSPDTLDKVWHAVDKVFAMQMQKHGVALSYTSNGRLDFRAKMKLYETCREDYIACMRTCQNIPSLIALGNEETLISTLEKIGLQVPVYSTKPIFTLMSRYTSQNYTSWKMPAHQDWRSIQGSLNNCIAWVSLADSDEEVGPIEVVPKSHLNGLLEVEKDDWYYKLKTEFSDDDYIPVPLNEGDCVVFSSFLVHRSGTNVSTTKARASLQFRYNDIEEPTFVERSYPSTYGSDRPEKDYVLDDGLTVTPEQVIGAL